MTRLARDDEQHYTRRDMAEMAGFDPSPDDLTQPVMAAGEWESLPFDHPSKVRNARYDHDRVSLGCRSCGERCDVCHDRMCDEFGPEPRACGTTCGDCPCDCGGCIDARDDLRAELQRQLEKDAS